QCRRWLPRCALGPVSWFSSLGPAALGASVDSQTAGALHYDDLRLESPFNVHVGQVIDRRSLEFKRFGFHSATHRHIVVIGVVEVEDAHKIDLEEHLNPIARHRPGGFTVEILGIKGIREPITAVISSRSCGDRDRKYSIVGNRQFNLLIFELRVVTLWLNKWQRGGGFGYRAFGFRCFYRPSTSGVDRAVVVETGFGGGGTGMTGTGTGTATGRTGTGTGTARRGQGDVE